MTQHTPGPWTIYGPELDITADDEVADRTVTVAMMCDDAGLEREANADLIAAAPAMVEALRDLVGQGDNGNYCDRCDSSLAEGHAEGCPIRAGEAALGAAEGLGDPHS